MPRSSSPPPGITPTIRLAARVVLLDSQDRLLLFRWEDARLDAKSVWITPGGGVQQGESFEEAAKRELWEETGIDAELRRCVWLRSHTFRLGDRWIEQRERYFLARTDSVEVRLDLLEPAEKIAIAEHRFWRIEDIASSEEWFAPREVATLAASLLAGTLPAEPIEIGV